MLVPSTKVESCLVSSKLSGIFILDFWSGKRSGSGGLKSFKEMSVMRSGPQTDQTSRQDCSPHCQAALMFVKGFTWLLSPLPSPAILLL